MIINRRSSRIRCIRIEGLAKVFCRRHVGALIWINGPDAPRRNKGPS
jgi:hypothetical protein